MIEDWLDMQRTFEIKKKQMDPSSNAQVYIRIPASLLHLLKNKTGEEFKDVIKNSRYASKIKLGVADKICLESELMSDLFQTSIKTTVALVKSILQYENARNISAILMVGEFSESLVLQAAIKKEFRDVNVIIPRDAALSVLRGAVAYGHYRFVKNRIP